MSAISVRIFQIALAGAAARGVDPDTLLAAIGVSAAALSDPDGRLPRAAELRLWTEAARLTKDESFGLHLSEQIRPAAMGPLGFAVRSSATLGEAYTRVIRYLRLIAHGPVVALRIDGDTALLRHSPPATGPAPSRHAVEFLMGTLVMLARRGVDDGFAPRVARFRHAAPARLDAHRALFGPGIRFDQPHDEIHLDRSLLDRRQAEAEPALSEVLDQHLASLLAGVPEEVTFLDRVSAALASELAHGEPTLISTAARLRMSPRTLQRRLRQEGTSLTARLDRVRADLAVRHLSESGPSIGEVAFVLGFSEVSTFHRAFKRWTGLTPAAYRRERGGAIAARRAG